jgi:hypothetical protein
MNRNRHRVDAQRIVITAALTLGVWSTWELPMAAQEAAAAAQPPAPPATAVERVGRLDGLLGTWQTVDVYRPDSPSPSVERGTRRCARALRERYVECVTEATNAAGRSREYRFYLTWDGERDSYTLLSFWSNVGGIALSTIALDAAAQVWDIRGTTPYVEDGVETRTWSTLRFTTPDAIVWEGRTNSSTNSPDSWPITFRETWTRVGEPAAPR